MKDMIPNRKDKGFTLIELVMVIVILGILAAFALPRFANLSGEARAATLEGASGAVKSAAAIAHSKWLASGKPSDGVTLDGLADEVDMSGNGYPTLTAEGIMEAAQLEATEFVIDGTVIKPAGFDLASDADGDGTAGECAFTYSATDGNVTNLLTDDCI